MCLFVLFSRGCIEGCYCPAGQYENDRNECVKSEECPCVHNGVSYEYGSVRKDRCNNW